MYSDYGNMFRLVLDFLYPIDRECEGMFKLVLAILFHIGNILATCFG